MKTFFKTFTIAATLLTGLLAFSVGTYAARPPDAGGGGGGGDTPGGGGKVPPDYGDQWILYRDSNGVPYVTPLDNGEGWCQQPLPSGLCPEACLTDGWADGEMTDVDVVALDQALCGVPAACAICTQEVEFERDNVIRAKESVLTTQLEDATIKLATAGCVTLDPAGRPVASSVVDSEVVSSAIDSPIQNLGFYKKLMQDGYLGLEDGDVDLLAGDWLDSAARALGTSMPKEGKATIDMVVYMNELLGLTEGSEASLLCNPCLEQQVREEVKGNMQTVTKRFLDYTGYIYDRSANFSTGVQSLPNPAYIPDDDPEFGWFEYSEVNVGGTGTDWVQGPILSAVFPEGEDSYVPYTGAHLKGFTQATDDTRAVINFMHTWPIPAEAVTPIVCENETPQHFDIFISPRSGLKVPVRMAAAGDGREGSVTVENGGPATAIGVTVMVTGKYEADGVIKDVPLQVSIDDDIEIFNDLPEELGDIEPGYSATKTFFFIMEETADITWTATAYPGDANSANNEVIKTTIVKKPKGGGGGGH